ncbi:uncharacterized protein N7446_005566 [Penicillium canescens]|uniref:Uncharacterized protein n=1 Tax=Penicillium canescens TaxID=5083 RepID=A0AAD6NBW0_PENCN|nr:uncharacterized protein N7446_005566 [Penicillium canescens]KAJ6050196.1 hypothetical protein N7444_006912 [Penicillium canescens]KAJ6050938.1 hypothetical protein N7460_001472 [Penicillium canescens]KAJ6061446.1 hypothetical protein N7446_005566 [Penicillium canescens]
MVQAIFKPQAQNNNAFLDIARNGLTQAVAKPSYRVIHVEEGRTQTKSVADFKDPFCIEWQVWSLQGVPLSDIFTHRVKLTEDKIVETERAIHPWLLEPCMADSLKKDPVVGKPRVIVKEGSTANDCLAFSIRAATILVPTGCEDKAPVTVKADFLKWIPIVITEDSTASRPPLVVAPNEEVSLSMTRTGTLKNPATVHLDRASHPQSSFIYKAIPDPDDELNDPA